MGGKGELNASAIVAGHFGWHPVNLGIGGTGYVRDGGQQAEFGSEKRLDQLRRYMPDVLLVFNGINDLDVPAPDRPGRLQAIIVASKSAYEAFREALPDSQIVVFGYFPHGEAPSDWLREGNEALAQTAMDAGLDFIDPTDLATFEGDFSNLIGADGLHPTDAGHEHLAETLIALLDQRQASTWVQIYETWEEAAAARQSGAIDG